jgi:MurNAc alpha-1-phosphate uridylyltransferase
MKAMILGAGRGARMGDLTENTSKLLLPVGGKLLIDYHIDKLIDLGVEECVINVCYQKEKIISHLTQIYRNKISFYFSEEKELLGVGGGIYHALPHLGKSPFILISGDMWSDYDLKKLPDHLAENTQAHLVMVDNPYDHPQGDYHLNAKGRLEMPEGKNTVNYACIALMRPEAVEKAGKGIYGLTKILDPLIQSNEVSAEYYQGIWRNLNTEKDWKALETYLKSSYDYR